MRIVFTNGTNAGFTGCSQLQFYISKTRACKFIKLIHTDLWEPMLTLTSGIKSVYALILQKLFKLHICISSEIIQGSSDRCRNRIHCHSEDTFWKHSKVFMHRLWNCISSIFNFSNEKEFPPVSLVVYTPLQNGVAEKNLLFGQDDIVHDFGCQAARAAIEIIGVLLHT